MNATEMIELRGRRPFVPFTLQLRDGSSIHVDEPNVVATGRDSPDCVIYDSDEAIRFVAYRDVAEVIMSPANGAEQGPIQ